MTLLRSTRSEFTKQGTTKVWWVLLIALIGYVGFIAAVTAASVVAVPESLQGFDNSPLVIYSLASSIGYMVPLLLGTLIVTAEYRHQTLTPTFLATPRRGVVLVAKMIVGAVLGVIFGIAGSIASVAPGAGILSLAGMDTLLTEPETWALVGRILISFVLWAVIGVGLGTLVPNQIGAVVGVLVFTLFIEPLLLFAQAGFAELKDVLLALPGAATNTLVGASIYNLAAASEPREWWVGGLILLGYALVFSLLGYLVRWRRDVN